MKNAVAQSVWRGLPAKLPYRAGTGCRAGGMLALGLTNGQVMLVDEATGEVMWAVQAHPAGRACHVAMSPSGKFVASVADKEAHWKLWEAASGAIHMEGASHDGTGACICVDELQNECPAVAHTAILHAVAFAPCGQRFATGDDAGAVIVWKTESGEADWKCTSRHVYKIVGRDMAPIVWSLSFSADGARLAGGVRIENISVWDVATGELLRTFPPNISPPRFEIISAGHVHFSPADNRMLGSAGTEGIVVWDIDSGERLVRIEDFLEPASVMFSPDGTTIAAVGMNDDDDDDGMCHMCHVFNAESLTLRFSMVDNQSDVNAASFSVDPNP